MSERKNLEESIAALQDSIDDGMAFRAGPHTRRVVDAACRHLETLSKSRVEWRVWWVVGNSDYSTPEPNRASADRLAAHIRDDIRTAQFIHVTGPHTVSA